jgi:general secretion pathway protein A
LFPAALMGSLYRLSKGIPRIINVLCDRALLGAYSQNKERVDRATLKQAAYEVFHNPAAQRRSLLRPLLAGLLLASTVFAVANYQSTEQAAPPAKIEIKAAAINQPTALPDVLEWPATQPIADSKSFAYAALFRAWGAEYQQKDDKKGDACKQAQAAGLRCMTERGWLDDLHRLNLPAVLQMHDKQGEEFSATLTGLDDKSVTFVVGSEKHKVSLSVLAAQWSGHYTLLWRRPPVASKKLRLGDYGPDVEWVGKQLARLDGKSPDSSNKQLFDEAMLRRVKQFQLDQGLSPDGRVGSQTLMRLGLATDSMAPKLHPEKD